jgi:hypothetical protein
LHAHKLKITWILGKSKMYRLICIGALFAYSSAGAMENICEQSSNMLSTEVATASANTIIRDASDLYVPENVNMICCLEKSTKCCYAMNLLCKAGMGLCEISALVLTGISVTEIKRSPHVAWVLGVASAASSGISLALTYGAFKTENKMRKLDKAVAKARRRRAETEL